MPRIGWWWVVLACGCGPTVVWPRSADAVKVAAARSEAHGGRVGSQASWWLRDPRVFERGGRWEIDVILDLEGGEVPRVRTPFRFDLRMRALYEKDGDRAASIHAVPVEGEPIFSFEQKVCFRSTQVAARRFRVPLTLGREDGFREGEYELSVVRLDTGRSVGASATVVLHPG